MNSQMHGAVLAEIQKRWNVAASTWDIKALSQIYSRDALFFGLLPNLYIGRAEIEKYFGSYLEVLNSVTLTLLEQNTRALGPSVFAAQGFGEIFNRRHDGSITTGKVRSSFVIVNVDGVWEISLHHFSEVTHRML